MSDEDGAGTAGTAGTGRGRRWPVIAGCGVGLIAAGGAVVLLTGGDDDPGGGAAGSTTLPPTTTTRPLVDDADRYELAYLSTEGEQTTVFLTDGAGSQTDVVARLEGRAEALRWSPDGERLLLDGDATGDFDVYVVTVEGGEVRNLTAPPGPAAVGSGSSEGGASWSPDGTRVAYFSDRDGAFAGYVAPVDGGAPTRVTPDGQVVSWLVWSPDGSQIAYAISGTGVATEVWIVGADGSSPRRLTELPGASMPAFSPDGTRVAVAGQPADRPTTDIFVIDVATGEAELAGGSDFPDGFPTWTADGSALYFAGEAPNEEEDGGFADDIFRVAVPTDGEVAEAEVVTEDPIGVEAEPTLTADGRLLAFSIRRSGDQEVFVANDDGSGAIPISRSPRADASPAWRPTP